MVEENFEICWPQMAINVLKLSTMVGQNCILFNEEIHLSIKITLTDESAESIQNCKGGPLQIFQLNQDKTQRGTITDFSAESRLNLAEISL